METSQQQRRSTIGQFAKTLADADLEFDAIDLIDMLWLAQFVEPGESGVPPEPKSETPERKPDVITSDLAVDEPELGLYPETSSVTSTTTETDTEPEKTPKGTPFSIPAAPAIRTRMKLARALRPLMRKVPSRTRFDLDEDATVTQIAETEVWMPVVCPTPERWLELDLVVESAKTTVIWERAIAELNHLAEYQGAFRTVRTWRLSAVGSQVQLFPRWQDFSTQSMTTSVQATGARPHTPRELLDPSGRRLIWLVTDCTSQLWRQGVIYAALQEWALAQPVAIVQMFPESLWKRTALRDGHQVKLSALAPGLPSDRLQVEGLPVRLERQGRPDLVTVPVVTLDSKSILHWAQVISGSGDGRTPGRTFDLAFIARQTSKAESNPPSRPAVSRTARERVDFFRATTASETVKHLANLMAVTPVSLPVIDLLRDAFRADFKEEVRQSDVAEVLLSVLIRRCDTEDDEVCRYEFWGDDSSNPDERVRDILLGDASVSKTIEVLNVLSASICKKIGSPVKSFQALLAEIHDSEQSELRDAALPLAKVGIDVLRRLGGEHAETARRYDSARRDAVVSPKEADDWLADFPLEPLTYEVAEYLNFPPLQPFDIIDAQFSDFPPPLQSDDFTIIT
ncbi:MAG: SAV_2336 N-terminal domain-related protein, partial [Verrucomicrobiota bacterium]